MKKRVRSGVLAGIVLCLLPGSVCSRALAAESSRITKVGLEVTADFTPGDSIEDQDVQLHTDSTLYKIDEWRILNEETVWEGSVVPVVEIILSQTDVPKFSYIGVDNLTIKGMDYAFVSSKRSEKDTILNLIVKFRPVEEENEPIGELALDRNGMASWTPDEHTSLYRIKVYRDSSLLGERSTYGTQISLQDLIAQPGNYRIKISGINKYDGKSKADWAESDSLYMDEATIAAFSVSKEALTGEWKKSGADWMYINPGEHPAAAQWQYIDGKWYFFDAQGIMQTGWIDWNESRYYCTEDGSMLADSVTPDGFRVGTDGAAAGKEN